MATQGDVSVHVPSLKRSKAFDGQKKMKEDLEKEVSVLHDMLDQEEKVHTVLERAIRRPDGSPLQIPTFLPPKMKELLAELAMVEDEISRLEKEISSLQVSLDHEQEVPKESTTKQWQQRSLSSIHEEVSIPPNQKSTFQRVHERLPFETKALYFISKAIKGDNSISGFVNNEKKEDSGVAADQKENHSYGGIRFFEKVSRTSGMQKPPSPNRPPRHSTSLPQTKEPGIDMFLDFSPKSISNSSPSSEEDNPKLQPNKLSERIMKCLIFIFVRLMRTSRAQELEKSSTISRSPHLSVSSRNFRVDSGLNSKTSLSLQRESKQQDPYGIFESDDSIPRDIGPYKNLVRFTSSSMDPKCINNPSSSPLLQKFRVLMKNLEKVDLRFLTHQQKLAFWINIYNACIMHGFLQYGVPTNPENMLALMNKATVQICGKKISALTIERHILRQPYSSNFKDVGWKGDGYDKEVATNSIYGLESREPNVTFALCFGTRSSPAVRIYTANGISTELEKSKLEYLQASIVVTNAKKLVIPELLFQNMHNFAHDVDSLIEWVCHQLPTSWSLRKLMVECFRAHNSGKISNIVGKMPYDFEFQYLLAA